jgi:FdhD protein
VQNSNEVHCVDGNGGMPPLISCTATRLKESAWESVAELAAREERVRVVHGATCRNLWAWPFDLGDLALGHELLECLPRHSRSHGQTRLPMAEDAQCHPCGVLADTTPVRLRTGTVTQDDPEPGLHVLSVCLGDVIPQAPMAHPLAARDILRAMERFIAEDGHWDATGSFHKAGILDPATGELIHAVEDIGRHNCLDRLTGYCARKRTVPGSFVLLVTARITGSLYAKARRAGFAFMVSRSAVTGASLLAAREEGTTLVGFCRPNEGRLTVFQDGRNRIRR